MILSDRDIKKTVEEGKLKVDPTPNWGDALGSCTLDLTLGEVEENKYTLNPGDFVLATTTEYIEIPDDLCGILHGRSSLGRQGLTIHSTAPMFDAGFRGKVVLELFNSGKEPITLQKGQRVCAMSFEQLSSPALRPYHKKDSAKYLNQQHPNI